MSKKDIVDKLLEVYTPASAGDKAFIAVHKFTVNTHYSPMYPDMDDILTARNIHTYVRSEHGRNHPVKGEGSNKAGQTTNPSYNQDHGYMPGEDEQFYFPHNVAEGKRYQAFKAGVNKFKKRVSDDYKKQISDPAKANAKKRSEHLVATGKKSADQHWKEHRDGTYHAADGHHYDYIRSKNAKGGQIHIRRQGSKSSGHETHDVDKSFSNEQAMRHIKGQSHIEHLYSTPETKPKMKLDETVMNGQVVPAILHSWLPKPRTNQPMKKPAIDPNVHNNLSNVAQRLGISVSAVAEGMGFPSDKPRQPLPIGDKPKRPRAPGGNPIHDQGGLAGGRFTPMNEDRYIISYVHKGTLKEGATKPWKELHKAEAQALAMMQSGLYEDVQIFDEGWRHVAGAVGAIAGAVGVGTVGHPIAGAIALGSGGYHMGLSDDIHNAEKKHKNLQDTLGNDHPDTQKAKHNLDRLKGVGRSGVNVGPKGSAALGSLHGFTMGRKRI